MLNHESPNSEEHLIKLITDIIIQIQSLAYNFSITHKQQQPSQEILLYLPRRDNHPLWLFSF
jgi:hypothetical protein